MSLAKWVVSGAEARLVNLEKEEERIRSIIAIEENSELTTQMLPSKPGLRLSVNWLPTAEEKELITEFYFSKIRDGMNDSDAAHEVRKTFRRAASFQPIYIERWNTSKVAKKRGRKAVEDNAEGKAKANEAIIALNTLPKAKPELCVHLKACLQELSVHPDFFSGYVDLGFLHCCHVRWVPWDQVDSKKATKSGIRQPTYIGLRERCTSKHCPHCAAVYFADSNVACDKHLLPCATCVLR